MLNNPLYDEDGPTGHAPVKACELPDGIELAHVDGHGRRRVVSLEDASLLDSGQVKEFRKPPAYRGQRNFPGWWWEAAIMAILSGTERIDETLLETVELDHAATQEAETKRQAARKSRKGSKK